jgi:hypothetical protein
MLVIALLAKVDLKRVNEVVFFGGFDEIFLFF